MFIFTTDKFLKHVREAMQRDNVSYRTLSRRTKISLSRLHSMLHGKARMSIHNMLEFCNSFDLNPYEYIDEKEYQTSFLEKIK